MDAIDFYGGARAEIVTRRHTTPRVKQQRTKRKIVSKSFSIAYVHYSEHFFCGVNDATRHFRVKEREIIPMMLNYEPFDCNSEPLTENLCITLQEMKGLV